MSNLQEIWFDKLRNVVFSIVKLEFFDKRDQMRTFKLFSNPKGVLI